MIRTIPYVILLLCLIEAGTSLANDTRNCDSANGLIDGSCPEVFAKQRAADRATKAKLKKDIAEEYLKAQMESAIPIDCARNGAWIRVGLDSDDNQLEEGIAIKRTKVNWQALMQYGPEKNSFGDKNRSGSRVARVVCGPFQVQVSAGFLNPNSQGELGAIDFPVVAIVQNGKILLRATALSECETPLSRYEYFGKCPDKWARSVTVNKESGKEKIRITVNREFLDANYNNQSRTDVYVVPNPAVNNTRASP